MSSGPGPLPGSSQHSPHRPRSVGARDRVLPGLRGLESEPALASAVSHAEQVTPRASGSPASPGFLSWEMGQHHHQPNEGNKLHEAVSPAPGAAEGGARCLCPSPRPHRPSRWPWVTVFRIKATDTCPGNEDCLLFLLLYQASLAFSYSGLSSLDLSMWQ